MADILTKEGFDVQVADSASAAMEAIAAREPHVLVSDLDLGSMPTGVDLLVKTALEFPWIGLVALTAYTDPALVSSGSLPRHVQYVHKTSPAALETLTTAIRAAIVNELLQPLSAEVDTDSISLTAAQAEVLRLVASGLSNEAIAKQRGISIRGAEKMVQRLFKTLGLSNSADNPRVAATHLWRQGKLKVK